MRLLFLDSAVLLKWVTQLVAANTGRRLHKEKEESVSAVSQTIRSYVEGGLHPACTLASAAEVVTRFFKRRHLPFTGQWKGFQVRKSLAREASRLLRLKTELLSPQSSHFAGAEELWFTWCDNAAKESYAQFSDYLDAALLLNPPRDYSVSTVLLGHPHVQYVLRRAQSPLSVCVVPVIDFR